MIHRSFKLIGMCFLIWAMQAAADEGQQIIQINEKISPGKVKTFSFLVDPARQLRIQGGSALFGDFTQVGLAVVLVDSTGRRIPFDASPTNDSSIRREEFGSSSKSIKAGIAGTVLIVERPPVGRWSLEVNASELRRNESVQYWIRIISEGAEHRLDVSKDMSTTQAGEPVHIQAHLRKQDQPVLGASVEAEMRSLFGESSTGPRIRLHDDGANGDASASDGVYTAIVILDHPGDYTAEVTATDGQTFARVGSALIQVAVSQEILFTGKLREETIDQNRNGKYEILDVVIEVDLKRQSKGLYYFVKGHLSSLDGRMLIHERPSSEEPTHLLDPSVQRGALQTTIDGGVPNKIGTHEIRLSFPGGWIQASKIDGPYQIHLCLEHDDSIFLGDIHCEGPQISHQSQPYRWEEFESK